MLVSHAVVNYRNCFEMAMNVQERSHRRERNEKEEDDVGYDDDDLDDQEGEKEENRKNVKKKAAILWCKDNEQNESEKPEEEKI